MNGGVTVLAKTLEVIERERDVWVIDVLWRQMDDVVNHLGRSQPAVLIATLAHQWRHKAKWGVNCALHIGFAVMLPCR